MKTGSRTPPCFPESDLGWAEDGHSPELLSGKLVLSTRGKASVPLVYYTHAMSTRVHRSKPTQIQRKTTNSAPLSLPNHLLDPVKMDSDVKLQAQVKSNSGGRGRDTQSLASPPPKEELGHPFLQPPGVTSRHSMPPGAPFRGPHACLLGEARFCPQEPFQRPAQPLQYCPHSSWKESRASPQVRHPPRSTVPAGTRKPGAYPLTSEWRFYPVPGHTPGGALGPGHAHDLVPLP